MIAWTPQLEGVQAAHMIRKTEPSHREILTKLSQRVPRQAQKFILLFCALVLFLLFLPHDSLPRNAPPPEPVVVKGFPRKIWQLWKVNSYALSPSEAKVARTWVEMNLGHRYELLSDTNEEEYIATTYGREGINRPDIVDWYRQIKDRIVRADVLRYLIMYAEGGVYADIDVEALQPIDRWMPDHYNVNDVEMVIGIEVDQSDFASHPILGDKSMTFCQWTFMSKPRHPVMLKLVEHIMAWMSKIAQERGATVSDVKLDFTDIISGTGPSAFANAILEYMSEKAGNKVAWSTFHNIAESKLVGGILVLPVEAYAAGQGHSDSGNHDTRRAFVKHHYHASKWPDTHPMFSHPMYGMVEDCNWKKDCVQKWDNDVAAWAKLSKEEQDVLLEEKKEEERKKEEEKKLPAEERLWKEAQKKKEDAEKAAQEAQKKIEDAEREAQEAQKKIKDADREAREAQRKKEEAERERQEA